MKFNNFKDVVSSYRISRYLVSCNNETRKAMTLYRYNILLSQACFSIISCFEIALRNAIDRHMTNVVGSDWLRDCILPGGRLHHQLSQRGTNTGKIIENAYNDLKKKLYSHCNLLTKLEFGVWMYFFSSQQYPSTLPVGKGPGLVAIFKNKPQRVFNGANSILTNETYFFHEIRALVKFRNRIAHHEPICFLSNSSVKSTSYVRTMRNKIITLLFWMDIPYSDYLYGLDHIDSICAKIDAL